MTWAGVVLVWVKGAALELRPARKGRYERGVRVAILFGLAHVYLETCCRFLGHGAAFDGDIVAVGNLAV